MWGGYATLPHLQKEKFKKIRVLLIVWLPTIVMGVDEAVGRSKDVVDLTTQSFDTEISKKPHMVMFYISR